MERDELRILLVDDEPLLVEIFSLWLERQADYKVSTAKDGQEALELLKTQNFDLLVTDVRMPRVDGVSLVRHLAQIERPLPSIIFVSGFGDVDEREMYALGVGAFLSKPVLRDDFLDTVKTALARRAELWHQPMDPGPNQSIGIQAIDFREVPEQDYVALGRGGFCAPYPFSVYLGKVSFSCYFSATDLTILGEGYVRWKSLAEGKVGIEFAYLEESCRAKIVEMILQANHLAFIPAH
jgi:CheY-like chemotaxis protein